MVRLMSIFVLTWFLRQQVFLLRLDKGCECIDESLALALEEVQYLV